MNQNTVSGNLDRIKRATDDMRLVTGTTGEDIETVAQAVSNLNDDNIAKDETIAELEQEIEDITPKGSIDINDNGTINVAGYQYANVNVSGGGGGGDGIYHVDTIEEMNALIGRRESTAKEGDLCVVRNENGSIGLYQLDSFDGFVFPETIVLEQPLQGETYCEIQTADSSSGYYCMGQISISGSSNNISLDLEINGDSDNIRYGVSYHSDDGINYDLTYANKESYDTSTGEPIDEPLSPNTFISLPCVCKCGGGIEGDELYVIDLAYTYPYVDFKGIYQCQQNTWELADIGLPSKPSDIVSGKKAYSNNGILTGTFGEDLTASDLTDSKYTNVLVNFNKIAIDGNLRDAIADLSDEELKVVIKNIDTSNITSMESAFASRTGLTFLDLPVLNTSNVTDMNHMFGNCYLLNNLNVSNFDTSKVTNMQSMFDRYYDNTGGLVIKGTEYWNTANVTNMSALFHNCWTLKEINLHDWNTAKVTNMSSMFYNCKNLTDLDLSSFDTAKVTNMSSMFYWCSGLTSLDLSNFVLSSNINLTGMFSLCYNLRLLDIRNMVFNNATMTEMFGRANAHISQKFPADCLIIVKSDTERNQILQIANWLTNIQTVEEYEGGNE